MKHKIFFLAILFSFIIAACKTTKDMHKSKNGLTMSSDVPLIDREVLFGNAEISSGSLSPDGSKVTFLKEYDGIMNIWVKDFDEKFEDAKLLTKSKSPILGFFWTRDGKYVLYVNDNDGDENMNIFAVDPSKATKETIPESRNLTPLKEVTAQIYMVSHENPDVMMVGINDRDKAWHDLYKLEISSGKLTKIFENNDRITGWDFDWDEKARIASRTDENGFSQLLRVDDDGSFHKIYETNLQESAYIVGWTPDNKKAYLVSNKGDVNLTGLYLIDPQTGETELVEQDPEEKVDLGGVFFNRNTREIVYTSYTEDKTRFYWRDKEFQKDYEYLKSKFPDREIGITSMTKDYSKWLVAVSGDRYATMVYFFDRKTKDLIHQYTPKPKLKEVEEYLVPMDPIKYPSSDGLVIPGYLSLPKGKAAKDLPLVVLVHGGPKGPRDHWGYHPYVQFLTNRGYAVLQPNFRASGGYGKEFLNAGDKQWGKLMQDDITWGVKYLVDKGIVDPKRVAIMGGSYGGYATLAGLAFTPDIYACGVDIVGPSNLFTLLESIPPYWEAGRKWLYEMVGDPDTEDGAKLLKESSPLFSAHRIKAPLMIIQGANDPRVKKAESDQIVIALRDKGQQVSYLLAEDEGHGFRKPLNRKAMMAEIEKFLAGNLGGRYQKDIPQDVQQTLEKLKVDISTVTLQSPDKVEPLQEYPNINVELKPQENKYHLTMNVQGQSIEMEKTRVISLEGDKVVILESSSGPMGDIKDKVEYSKGLKPLSRYIDQGSMQIPIEYGDRSVDISMMGKKINIKTEGAIVCDGPGMDLFIHGLHLKEGEQISFFVTDLMGGKEKQVMLAHEGADGIDGHKVQRYTLVSIDNDKDVTTYYLDDQKGIARKIVKVIPAMGNAIMEEILID